ncbi:MAG: hypothetical protein EPN62_05685 [Candidimonas sp.]|nr:MAG: hypothetical protein EPN77_16740 [Candidimonas sp.]TAM24798.1 MAG: hypothetical protein EPN62_05685 [Candidimonas sp.]
MTDLSTDPVNNSLDNPGAIHPTTINPQAKGSVVKERPMFTSAQPSDEETRDIEARIVLIDMGYLWDGDQWVFADAVMPGAQPSVPDVLAHRAKALIPKLQSLFDRREHNIVTIAAFEADGDTMREAIALCRAVRGTRSVNPTPPADWQAYPRFCGIDLAENGIQMVRNAALEEAACHCESRAGLRGTGAWAALTAVSDEIRAMKSKPVRQDAGLNDLRITLRNGLASLIEFDRESVDSAIVDAVNALKSNAKGGV